MEIGNMRGLPRESVGSLATDSESDLTIEKLIKY